MKLELKHLSPYLPYELGMKRVDGLSNKEHVLCSIHINQFTFSVRLKDGLSSWVPIQDSFRPKFRPLSQLTEEIEHNGERFIPIDRLNDLYGYEQARLVYYANSGLGWNIDYGFSNTAITFEDMHLPIQKLFEWHFDVFGLIEAGLAVQKEELP